MCVVNHVHTQDGVVVVVGGGGGCCEAYGTLRYMCVQVFVRVETNKDTGAQT